MSQCGDGCAAGGIEDFAAIGGKQVVAVGFRDLERGVSDVGVED